LVEHGTTLSDKSNRAFRKLLRPKLALASRKDDLQQASRARVARFVSAILTKTGKNIPINQQMYQIATNYKEMSVK
jgi:hypothetical protein